MQLIIGVSRVLVQLELPRRNRPMINPTPSENPSSAKSIYKASKSVPAHLAPDKSHNRVWSQVESKSHKSDRKNFRAQLGLTRNYFECIHSFNFCFLLTERFWLCQEATIQQRSDQRLTKILMVQMRNKGSSRSETLAPFIRNFDYL